MGRDDDSGGRGLLYMGIGALAAVGAGYLVWRYVLSDETKEQARAAARRALHQAQDKAGEAVVRGREAAHHVAEAAGERVRHVAHAASEGAHQAAETVKANARGTVTRLSKP